MTKSQEKTIERIKKMIVEMKSCGNPERYEFKQFEIKEYGYFVSLTTEYGMKGDDGTMASVICRDHRHMFIGKKGGVELKMLSSNIHSSFPKNVRGAFACVNYYHPVKETA